MIGKKEIFFLVFWNALAGSCLVVFSLLRMWNIESPFIQSLAGIMGFVAGLGLWWSAGALISLLKIED